VTTVAGISANVTSVANNASNINQVASDTVAINSASANATSAAASALSASNSATSASASAAAASAVALGSEPVRHSVRPSLLLDFANTKQLDPRITFTRASTGTFYDGKTVAKAEENLLQYSQEFDNAYWTKSGVTVTANSTTAPDGVSTADSLLETADNSAHGLTRGVLPQSVVVVCSIFVKANGRNFAMLGNTEHAISVDLTTGVASSATGSPSNITSVNAGNGWWRVSFSATYTTTTILVIYSSTDGILANRVYAGDITKGVFLWGAQIEQRSSATAYTATTTAPITNYIPALQTAASGVARFEHNPVTGESLGLEIEEQRTNLFTYSSDWSNAIWSKANIGVLSNEIVSPDGTLNGTKLRENTTDSTHVTVQNATVVDATTYTFSCYAKVGEISRFRIRFSTSGAGGTFLGSADFDLSTGTVSASSNITSSSITPVGNGWYRCTATEVSSGTTLGCGLFLIESGSTTSYQGDGYSGFFIWGAQLEAGSFATSYIPTVASQVTRSADSATMTGSNFTSWYRADAHTAYSEYTVLKAPDATVNSNAAFGYGDGTGNEYVHLDTVQGATQIRGLVRAKATTYSASQGTVTAGTTIKAAIALSAGNGAFSANGATATAVNPVVMPLPTFANIGKNTAFSVFLNGNIKKVAFYPARLTNAEIQSLTTV
jgi:hypothetical protein